MTEMAKTTRTVNMDSDRFTCILSEYSRKQHRWKRQYLECLPYYINEREKNKKVTEFIVGAHKKQTASQSKKKGIKFDTEDSLSPIKCPPRKVDNALDPEMLKKAE